MEEDKYWDPVIETLPREKLQQLQLAKFKKIFSWAYERSKFHHKLYTDAGIEPGDIRTFDDIRKVPKVEKLMMRVAQGKTRTLTEICYACPWKQLQNIIRPAAQRGSQYISLIAGGTIRGRDRRY